ncbi:hypothetical protein ACLOJK_006754 [Asimina triloba]
MFSLLCPGLQLPLMRVWDVNKTTAGYAMIINEIRYSFGVMADGIEVVVRLMEERLLIFTMELKRTTNYKRREEEIRVALLVDDFSAEPGVSHECGSAEAGEQGHGWHGSVKRGHVAREPISVEAERVEAIQSGEFWRESAGEIVVGEIDEEDPVELENGGREIVRKGVVIEEEGLGVEAKERTTKGKERTTGESDKSRL